MTLIRKTAAILAADIVGFGRLTQIDEDGALARLRTLRRELVDPTVSRHRGRVFKRTGDGFLAEFRYAVGAVRCAADIQTALSVWNFPSPAEIRFELRIGVHLAEIVEEADGDLMGGGVNVAVRLEGAAEPGSVYVSQACRFPPRIDPGFPSRTDPGLMMV